MRSNAQSVSARRAKAIALIKSGAVHSQSDLVVLLEEGWLQSYASNCKSRS